MRLIPQNCACRSIGAVVHRGQRGRRPGSSLFRASYQCRCSRAEFAPVAAISNHPAEQPAHLRRRTCQNLLVRAGASIFARRTRFCVREIISIRSRAAGSGGAEVTSETSERIANPFSTRWVRPGAVPYCFPPEMDAAGLVESFRQNDRKGAIAGPHGSGKSTLLATLIPEIEKLGYPIEQFVLHAGQRELPHGLNSHDHPKIFVVDGFEQLGWLSRLQIAAAVRRNACGLLVTVHDEGMTSGLPVIFRAAGDLRTLQHIVDHCLPSHDNLIVPDDVTASFQAHRGNMREALFALYDLFEQRR